MKSFIFLLSFLSFSLSSFSQISEFGFRKAKWGMTIEEVKATETDKEWQSTDIEVGHILYFETEISGLEATAAYYFINKRFEKGVYMITEEHSNKTEYISDYNNLKEILTNKYGKPTTDNTYWSNDLFKDDPQDYGTAVSAGHVSYFAFWKSAAITQGIIAVTLQGDNYEIDLRIGYESPTFEKALDDVNKVIEQDVF